MPSTSITNNTHPQWWKDPAMRKLNLLLLSCYLGAMSNGYASSLISSLMADPRFFADLKGLENVTLLGLVVSGQPLGSIIAFLPAPWLSDKFGRRAGIAFGNMCMIGGFIGQVLCRNAGAFLAMRLLAGFGCLINILSSSALLLELAHPRQRAVAGALFNTFYFVGSIASSWASYGALNLSTSWSWRLPVTIQLFWAVAQTSLLFFCPESPRWLVAHGKTDQAKATMATYHANGRTDDPLMLSELDAITTSTELEMQSRDVRWTSLFTTPGNRKRLVLSIAIGIATQWVGNGIITFYLAPVLQTVGITSALKQQGINGGLQIYNWLLACSAALLAERAGRRRLFLASAGTMLIFMIMVTVCSARYSNTQSAAAGYAVIVFLFLFFSGYIIGLTPIPILYINEIWPSHLRAKGASIFWVTQAVANCFNQYVNPIALRGIMWRYYLVYVGVLVAVVAFMFFYVPETKGLSLEEISSIFDGHRAGGTALQTVDTRDNHTEEVP